MLKKDNKKRVRELKLAVNCERDSKVTIEREIKKRLKYYASVKIRRMKTCRICSKEYLTENPSLCPECARNKSKQYNQTSYKKNGEKIKQDIKSNRQDNCIYVIYDFLDKEVIYIGETTDYKHRMSLYKNRNEKDTSRFVKWLIENDRHIEEFFIFKFDLAGIMPELSGDKKQAKKLRKILEQYLEKTLPHIVHTNKKLSYYDEEVAKYLFEKLVINSTSYEIEYYTNIKRNKTEKQKSILYHLYHEHLEAFELSSDYDSENLRCRVTRKNKK
ncbi:MAG: hypothetical protein E7231_00020 [Cellulosilyticum sp.]|nr:hypothetical protein [Cellulosilyticum sp.]